MRAAAFEDCAGGRAGREDKLQPAGFANDRAARDTAEGHVLHPEGVYRRAGRGARIIDPFVAAAADNGAARDSTRINVLDAERADRRGIGRACRENVDGASAADGGVARGACVRDLLYAAAADDRLARESRGIDVLNTPAADRRRERRPGEENVLRAGRVDRGVARHSRDVDRLKPAAVDHGVEHHAPRGDEHALDPGVDGDQSGHDAAIGDIERAAVLNDVGVAHGLRGGNDDRSAGNRKGRHGSPFLPMRLRGRAMSRASKRIGLASTTPTKYFNWRKLVNWPHAAMQE